MDKLTLLIGGVVIAGAAAFVYNLNQQPTGHSMTPPDTSALEQGDPIENVNLPEQLSEFAAVGKVGIRRQMLGVPWRECDRSGRPCTTFGA